MEKKYLKIPDCKLLLITLEIDTSHKLTLSYPVIPYTTLKTYLFPQRINVSDENIKAVGIDLGTSRCCAAVNRRNGIETVALGNTGGRLLPSYVAYDEEVAKFGQIVIDRLRYFANSSAFDVKRFMGKDLKNVKVDINWPFSLVEVRNKNILNNSNWLKNGNKQIFIKLNDYKGKDGHTRV